VLQPSDAAESCRVNSQLTLEFLSQHSWEQLSFVLLLFLLQVGSFEEVLMRMSASEGGELAAWSQVMFVAPGLLQQAQQGRALEAPGGKKK
jgi:hypothetical protein